VIEAAPDPGNLFAFGSVSESASEFDISDPEVIRMLEESQRTHFWFPARNLQILEFLRREGLPPAARVLEIGCGTGTVLAALAGAGYCMSGVEMHHELARRAAARNPASRIYSLDVLAPPPEFLKEGLFDAVGLFDVVEHLARPEEFLRACVRFVRPGGLLVGTVPALRMLWSDYDGFAGHRLRYDKQELRKLFVRAGIPRPRASYFFQVLVPGMLARRLLVGRDRSSVEAQRRASQHLALDPPGKLWNGTFAALCALERRISRAIPLSVVPGTSLWFSARTI
jgi:SAM-dependent methyltransferase